MPPDLKSLDPKPLDREPLDLKREFVAQLVESSRPLRNYIEHRAKGRGTTRAQLFRLRQQEGLSQVDLADVLELQPISPVRLLDRLVEHGFSSGATTPGIGAPTGCISPRGAVSLSMISTVCAIPLRPMCCEIPRLPRSKPVSKCSRTSRSGSRGSYRTSGHVAAKYLTVKCNLTAWVTRRPVRFSGLCGASSGALIRAPSTA
jgi:hypothetical protein